MKNQPTFEELRQTGANTSAKAYIVSYAIVGGVVAAAFFTGRRSGIKSAVKV